MTGKLNLCLALAACIMWATDLQAQCGSGGCGSGGFTAQSGGGCGSGGCGSSGFTTQSGNRGYNGNSGILRTSPQRPFPRTPRSSFSAPPELVQRPIQRPVAAPPVPQVASTAEKRAALLATIMKLSPEIRNPLLATCTIENGVKGHGTLYAKGKVQGVPVGLVVTNEHVLSTTADTQVRWVNGHTSKARLLRADKEADLAILLVSNPPYAPVPVLETHATPSTELFVWAIGKDIRRHKGEMTQLTAASHDGSRGQRAVPAVPSHRYITPVNQIVFSKSVNGTTDQPVTAAGSVSGAGMFDPEGQLAGILWGADKQQSYGTSTEAMADLVRALPEEYQLAGLFRNRRTTQTGGGCSSGGCSSGGCSTSAPNQSFAPPPSSSPNASFSPPPLPPELLRPSPAVPMAPAVPSPLFEPELPVTPDAVITQTPAKPAQSACACDTSAIDAKLAQITDLLEGHGPDQLAMFTQKLDELEHRLTEQAAAGNDGAVVDALDGINKQLGDLAASQKKGTDALATVAQVVTATNAKLDNIGESSGTVELVVGAPANLPPSYVDTSTLWALQRKTGISHAVLVVNAADPEWARLEAEYKKSAHKFPAMQLVDVSKSEMKVSPTPQLVIYYTPDTEKEPEVIAGDRNVFSRLREFYNN